MSVSPATDRRTFLNESRSIDLDRNGSADFVFSYFYTATADFAPSDAAWQLYVWGNDSNQVQSTSPGGPIPMRDSMLIDETIGWTVYGALLAGVGWSAKTEWEASWSGVWIGVGKRSLALRIRHQGGYYYGWVKLSVDSTNGVLALCDSACQPLMNTPILAGVHP
jgi:hypothetical protein